MTGRAPGSDESSTLDWVFTLLWPEGSSTRPLVDRGQRRGRGTWCLLPSATEPTLLAPASGAPAASALRQYNDSMTQGARIRKALLGSVLRLGGARLLGRDTASLQPTAGEGADFITDVVPRTFGLGEAYVAISIGRQLRPNLKPVLQVISPGGRVVGYVKIGWNDVTRTLVANEASVLRGWEGRSDDVIRVPRLLEEGTWGSLTYTALSPLRHRPIRRGARNRPPGVDVVRWLAARGGLARRTLGASGHLDELRRRIDELREPERLAGVGDRLLELRGDVELEFGRAHGDWTPWNMAKDADGIDVWDWERSATGVPFGMDIAHFAFEVAFHKRGLAPREAAQVARNELARSLLPSASRDAIDTTWRCYLLERAVRTAEGAAVGVAIDPRLTDRLVAVLEGTE